MKSCFIKRFNLYQKERFPLIVLLFTTTSVILSSLKIISPSISVRQIVIILFGALAYLFHLRVVDEWRDYNHDNRYHQLRPIPQNIISIKELVLINLFGILFFLTVAVIFGLFSTIIGIIALGYSFIAAKDFFRGYKIREAFYIYSILGVIQLLILQLFIYVLISKKFYFNHLVWLHLLFVLFGSIIVEIIRKTKIKDEESGGKDTYSWRLGFSGSLYTCSFLAIFDYLIFGILVYLLGEWTFGIFIISLPFLLFLLLFLVFHYIKRNKKSENLLLLFTIIFYVGLNLIIYFSHIFS